MSLDAPLSLPPTPSQMNMNLMNSNYRFCRIKSRKTHRNTHKHLDKIVNFNAHLMNKSNHLTVNLIESLSYFFQFTASVLIESDMFMDAMTAATTKKEVRKRKRLPSVKDGDETPKTETKPAQNLATSPTSGSGKDVKDVKTVPVAPMRFYQDTLEDSDNKDEPIKKEAADADDDDDGESKEKKIKTETSQAEIPLTADSPEEPPVKREPGPGCGPDGPPGVLTIHRRKGPKKQLRWRPQEQLEEVRFFELDETERINVTKTFVDAKQSERTSEREAFLISRKIGSAEDTMVEQMAWQPLILVEDVPAFEPGSQSKERLIQAEREKTCLKTIYFNRSMIPDSPLEPDVITFQNVEAPTIPLYDVTGNPDAVHDFTSMPWPEAKTSPQQIGNFDDLTGNLGNFSALNQFNSLNWPGQGANMLGMRTQPQLGFGSIIAGADTMNLNAIQAFGAANMTNMQPMLGQGFAQNTVGFMNNFGQNVPQMMGNENRNRVANWFTGNNNNQQSNNNWKSGNNNGNNQRQGGTGWVQNRRVCKQFQRGFCRHGDSCKFYHPANGPKF